MAIGFSTGSIALGDFDAALQILKNQDIQAIELSALREEELYPLFISINKLDLAKYDYISVHAPSKRQHLNEKELIDMLLAFAEKTWPIVVHPDIIDNYDSWKILGSKLCIENMDKRKPIGRTVTDLKQIFEKLPQAGFCLDVGHAKQVDPTMTECYLMIKEFKNRLLQIHLSDVTTESKHVPLNEQAVNSFRKIVKYLPENLPIILESPILGSNNQKEAITREIICAQEIFHFSHTVTY
jgi:Xylose isomerase-like TIM barrel